MSVCAYTCVCEEDAHWLPTYLAEAQRLRLEFFMHFDRCLVGTRELVIRHPRCLGITTASDPKVEFNETHKQWAFDRVVSCGFDWAIGWDVDEVFAKDAREALDDIDENSGADLIDFKWVNVWGDDSTIRTDGPFSEGHRANLYNLRSGTWKFGSPITNGAKLYQGDRPVLPVMERRYDLVVVHRGLSTPELRKQHKDRWDRIYSTALKGDSNPYGMWRFATDETIVPKLEPNVYL